MTARGGAPAANKEQLWASSRLLTTTFITSFERRLRLLETPEWVCGMHRASWFRGAVLRLVGADAFDVVIACVIVINTLILTLYDPLSPPSTPRNLLVDRSSLAFTVVFTVEMLLKLVAYGAVGKGSYFADRWNWLDAAVVMLGWVALSPSVVNVSAIRLLRLLRSLTVFPGMRVVLNAILNSIPGLTHVCVLALLSLTVFGMLATQLWSGTLAGTCYYDANVVGLRLPPFGNDSVAANATEAWTAISAGGVVRCALPCSQFEGDCTATYGDACMPYRSVLDPGTAAIPYAASCRRGANPDSGQTTFDNLPSAM